MRLYWLTPWAVTLGARAYWFHSPAAGAFLFTVYNFWSGGMPWGFANSLATGPWGRQAQLLQVLTWISVGAVLAAYGQRYRVFKYGGFANIPSLTVGVRQVIYVPKTNEPRP